MIKKKLIVLGIAMMAAAAAAGCSRAVTGAESSTAMESRHDKMGDDMKDDKMSDDKMSGNMKDDKMSDDKMSGDMKDDKMSDDKMGGDMKDDKMSGDKMKSTAMKADQMSDMKVEGYDFTLKDMSGNDYTLSDFRGKKVYIKFWASWCSICLAGMEELNNLAGEGNDFEIVTVVAPGKNGEKDKESFKKWFEGLNYRNIKVLFDEDGEVQKHYGVRAFPTSVFVGSDGEEKIRVGHTSDADIKAEMESLGV